MGKEAELGAAAGEKPQPLPAARRTQAKPQAQSSCLGFAPGGQGRGGAGRAELGWESAGLLNEEVIQLARISLSAAFIKCRSSRAIRGRREAANRGEGRGSEPERGALSSRLGGRRVRKIKKRGKAKTGPQRRNSSTKQPTGGGGRGCVLRGASIVLPTDFIRN